MADSGADPLAELTLSAHAELLHVLLDELARTREAGDLVRRVAVARGAIEAFPVAAAILRESEPIANAAWSALFGAELPPQLAAAVAERVPECFQRDLDVRFATYVGRASIYVRALGAVPASLAIAVETTDRVLEHELGIAMDALVWHRDATGDAGHYSARWRARVGAPWPEAAHHADLPRWHAALDEAARGHAPPEYESRLRTRDGTYRWHRVRIRIAGERIVVCAIDVHALRRRDLERNALLARARTARADAAAATRIKDEFLAKVSHELRAPLMTMLLWERVLRDHTNDEATRQKALDAIHQSAAAQARLVTDLLDFSRGISGKLFVDIRDVDLAQIAADAVEAARPLASGKAIDLALASPLSCEVRADATRLRQILDNLLSNAIKFTPSNGRVDVTVTRRGGAVAVDVADTGCGITPEHLERVFDPFVQDGDDELARRAGGMGLGLTISRQLAELHYGSLAVASEGTGRGATFTLTLPAADSPDAPPSRAPRHAPKLAGTHVLVIDDDAHVRTALALLLARSGAVVDTADNAESGRTRIVEAPPHVVICDIGLPGEDGYVFVRRLRASGFKIPTVALTAYAARTDAELALAAGFDVHLAKPVSVERLIATLSELLVTSRKK